MGIQRLFPRRDHDPHLACIVAFVPILFARILANFVAVVVTHPRCVASSLRYRRISTNADIIVRIGVDLTPITMSCMTRSTAPSTPTTPTTGSLGGGAAHIIE